VGKRANSDASCCYLRDFKFNEGREIEICGERRENAWNDYPGKICTRDDNCEQWRTNGLNSFRYIRDRNELN
jgi:hypothetical protein